MQQMLYVWCGLYGNNDVSFLFQCVLQISVEIKIKLKWFVTKETMSDTASKAKSDTSLPSVKRRIKFTAKGLKFFVKMRQETRSLKCKHVKKYMELMESTDNVNSVQSHLGRFTET